MSQNTFINGIGYEGKVTLTLKSNNRVLKSKTYKNSGTNQLFTFLGRCLIGDYSEVTHLLPYKILLLHNSSSSPSEGNSKNVTISSAPCFIMQTPTIESDDSSASVRVFYNFEVSRNTIFGTFNQIALYGIDIEDPEKFSAYYFLTDEDGSFEVMNAALWSATTVLLIEWELSISNKNTETLSQGGQV